LIETCRQERPNTKWESIAVSESSWGTAIEQVG
jgi:hypothetical protein